MYACKEGEEEVLNKILVPLAKKDTAAPYKNS